MKIPLHVKTELLPILQFSLTWILLWSATPRVLHAQENPLDFFESQIRPALHAHCLECHHQGKASGGLYLDARNGWEKGGDSGPAIVKGKPLESLLYRSIAHIEPGLEMPSKSPKVPDAVLQAFKTWIENGASDPRDTPEPFDPTQVADWETLSAQRATWWAWQPPHYQPPPTLDNSPGPTIGEPNPTIQPSTNPSIDDWIDHKLSALKIEPSPQADPATLVRRLSFTLRGLPPSIEELQTWVPRLSDSTTETQAWQDLVNQMLASREYAEHWARHWLDIVRYAETHGSEDDAYLPFAYRYRDYMIRAFESDLPIDRLIQEHLAGDLIAPRLNPHQKWNESLIGLSFLRLVEFNQTPVDVKREEIAVIDSQIDTIGKAFQALTISCARCHDHKFDPISDEDYYALYGILSSTRTAMRVLEDPASIQSLLSDLKSQQHPLGQKFLREMKSQISQWREQISTASHWVRQHAMEGTKWEDRKWEEIQSILPDDPWTKRLALWAHRPKKAPTELLLKLLLTDENNLKETVTRLAESHANDSRSWNTWNQELLENRTPTQAANQENTSSTKLLFDLRNLSTRPNPTPYPSPSFDGWRVTGFGLPEFPSNSLGSPPNALSPTQWCVSTKNPQILLGIAEAGYHSNLYTDRAAGTLRSPDFIVDSDAISLRCQGSGNARARLVIENFQGDSLLFSTLNPTLSSADPTWYTLHIRPQWKGLRAHLEVMTANAKPYVGIIKDPSDLENPSTHSSFALSMVVTHRSGAPLPSPPPTPDHWLESPNVTHDPIDSMIRSLEASLDRLIADQATDEDVRWVNRWILSGAFSFNETTLEKLQAMIKLYQQSDSNFPALTWIPGVVEDHLALDHPWLQRGDHHQPGHLEPRRYLNALKSQPTKYQGTSSGRLQLALEITAPENPLTARVMVNRIWYWLHGEGIVPTVDNFGRMGEPPTHPELLDALALEFLAKGWSTKEMIKTIVSTKTWKRSSIPTQTSQSIDPNNRFLAHANLRRLEAESIRDSMLCITGKLKRPDSGLGTKNFYKTVMEPNKQAPSGPLLGEFRRSIYLEIRRNFPDDFLVTFDQPRPAATVGKRHVSNGPIQSLALLNDPMVFSIAQLWAERMLALETDPKQRIHSMFNTWLSRPATDEEIDAGIALLNNSSAPPDSQQAWTIYALALLNLKEGLYVR
jgi:hypothetical protein